MSLKITSKIKTIEGFEVENAYGRVSVTDVITGKALESIVVLFVSKADFEENKAALQTDIITYAYANYDRATMGSDILNLAHDQLIKVLADQGITAVKEL